ncbi:hypothetical protein ACP70R_020734 [Stipagrostis hirtigluma subsp. patula]
MSPLSLELGSRASCMSRLRTAAFLAGVAARAAVWALDRFARWQVLLSVTDGITLADRLLYATATWGDEDEAAATSEPSDGAGDLLAAVGAAGIGFLVAVGAVAVALAACTVVGCCLLAASDDGGISSSKRKGGKPRGSEADLPPGATEMEILAARMAKSAGAGSRSV